MNIRNVKTKVIAPILLLIPMACMHLGDGHHSGDHHSSMRQPSYPYSIDERTTGSPNENCVTRQDGIMAWDGKETQPEGEKGG